MTMPMVVAHRGGAGRRPENTLAACAHALKTGADGVEIDVRLSRDGEVVVFHDPCLDPRHVRGDGGRNLTGDPPLVRDLSFSELRRFDAGYPRSGAGSGAIPPVPGERIPSLEELLRLLDGMPGRPALLIELKTDFETASPLDPGELTGAVLEVLNRHARKTPFLLLSFDWRCLVHAMHATGPERCVFLTAPGEAPVTAGQDGGAWFAGHPPARYGGSAVQAIRALGGCRWGAHHGSLDARIVSEAREAGIEVAAWTVNEPRHLMRMQAFGVDCLITDYPDRAVKVRSLAQDPAAAS